MSGFTPVFDTVFDGTLCGRWPTLPVWLTILPMADKNGHIDMTFQAIAARSGWPLELLKQAFVELMAPDPESRTAECEGRRLELLDPDNRQWGWRVINHRGYREKARKASFDAARVEDGRNRERMQTRADPRSPAQTRNDPPSDSNSDSNSDVRVQNARDPRETGNAVRTPLDSLVEMPPALSLRPQVEPEADIHAHILEIKADWPRGCPHEDWITAEKLARNLVLAGELWETVQSGVRRYAKFCKATNRMVRNPATWFADISRPWLSDWAIPPKPGEKPAQNHDAAWAEARSRAKAIGFRDPLPAETPTSYMTEIKRTERAPAMVPIAERRGLAGVKRIGAK